LVSRKSPLQAIQRWPAFLCTHLGSMHVTETTETPSKTEQQPEIQSEAATTQSAKKTILACSIFALGLNACAAVYTLSPSDFTFPDVSRVAELVPDVSVLAELLPQQKASEPVADPVLAALKDIQSAQQQHLALLQDSNSSLHQNSALLQQDTSTLGLLRQSITDERVDVKKISSQISDEHLDVKKISAQISTLIAKVDSLQSAIAPEVTSSIPKGRARNRLSSIVRRKPAPDAKKLVLDPKMAPDVKPVGPVSIGGAPLATGEDAGPAAAMGAPASAMGAPASAKGVPAGFPLFAPAPKG
jgi:hypothetical protein